MSLAVFGQFIRIRSVHKKVSVLAVVLAINANGGIVDGVTQLMRFINAPYDNIKNNIALAESLGWVVCTATEYGPGRIHIRASLTSNGREVAQLATKLFEMMR